MIEFGKELRAAREARGYTIAQVAEATKMMPSIVEGLEREDFSMIVAPIYGRGFVKLYCQAVGLEPKAYVDEFMDILNGKREDQIRERPASPESRPEEPQILPREQPQDEAPRPVPSEAALPDEPAPTAGGDSFSRYATPIRQALPEVSSVRIWRIAIIAALALVFLWALILGFRALYSATGSSAAGDPGKDVRQERPVAVPGAARPAADPANASRTPQRIPSLYID